MTYIKEAHGGVFRRVALSGLIDSANRANKNKDNVQTTRVIRHVSHSETEDQADISGTSYYLDEKGQRKLLFKKRSTSSTCAVIFYSKKRSIQKLYRYSLKLYKFFFSPRVC